MVREEAEKGEGGQCKSPRLFQRVAMEREGSTQRRGKKERRTLPDPNQTVFSVRDLCGSSNGSGHNKQATIMFSLLQVSRILETALKSGVFALPFVTPNFYCQRSP